MIAQRAKAVTAAATATLGGIELQGGVDAVATWSAAQWFTLALWALVAYLGVYAVPNADPPGSTERGTRIG
jgi:hypothetical protein